MITRKKEYKARHLMSTIDRHRQLADPVGQDALDVGLPEREKLVVASREVADVETRHSSLQSCCSLRNSLPQNAPHLFCARRSITPMARSQTSCKWRKQTSGNSSPVLANTSQMAAARPSARTSSGAFWRPLSVPPRRETWLDWNIYSRRMLFLTRMSVDLRGSGSPSFWPQASSNVHCRCLHMVLEGRDA